MINNMFINIKTQDKKRIIYFNSQVFKESNNMKETNKDAINFVDSVMKKKNVDANELLEKIIKRKVEKHVRKVLKSK